MVYEVPRTLSVRCYYRVRQHGPVVHVDNGFKQGGLCKERRKRTIKVELGWSPSSFNSLGGSGWGRERGEEGRREPKRGGSTKYERVMKRRAHLLRAVYLRSDCVLASGRAVPRLHLPYPRILRMCDRQVLPLLVGDALQVYRVLVPVLRGSPSTVPSTISPTPPVLGWNLLVSVWRVEKEPAVFSMCSCSCVIERTLSRNQSISLCTANCTGYAINPQHIISPPGAQ
ncbi:hypothetical protein F4861DRAFT_369070 [Xylaria intraflava]|nr:hypothetical protein F4861DRAFT_369070 [Xylaria intraflava]